MTTWDPVYEDEMNATNEKGISRYLAKGIRGPNQCQLRDFPANYVQLLRSSKSLGWIVRSDT
jgi:hypothetical protein